MPKYHLFRWFIVFICLFSSGLSIYAQDLPPIQTDRPDQTESPAIVPKNHFQMETGMVFEKGNESTKNYTHPNILFKYGLNDHFELRLITEYNSINVHKNVTAGISPVKVGFKVNITQQKGIIPNTSFIGHLVIPYLASDAIQTTYYAPEFRFTMQHSLSPKLSLSYNLGAEWDGETPDPAFIYTLTGGYAITEKLGSYLELYGFVPQKNSPDHRIDAGFTYLVKNNMQWDVSGGLGFSNNSPDYFVGLGFSFRLKN